MFNDKKAIVIGVHCNACGTPNLNVWVNNIHCTSCKHYKRIGDFEYQGVVKEIVNRPTVKDRIYHTNYLHFCNALTATEKFTREYEAPKADATRTKEWIENCYFKIGKGGWEGLMEAARRFA